ncbi:ABC transporter permease [Lacrimispora sp.]|uniref:ABC transporter permease n=1 Tax=Lacrimispora sp. TaxID=2719234 RepID=UPI0028A5EE37|nr:ABC transporter permease [Lacrimispora sp.]
MLVLSNFHLNLSHETLETIWLTMKLGFVSTFLSSLFGIPLGLLLERRDFFGKKIILRINRTLMGFPPVVVGLMVYLLLMRRGPFGELSLLFSFAAMVIAQLFIITPIVSGMVCTAAKNAAPEIRTFAISMNASRSQTFFLLIKEMKHDIYFALATSFGRSISEVGAVMIVGGNIQYKTRTMTTAISLMRNKGDYSEAITLGVVLLILSFCIQTLMDTLKRYENNGENY